MPAERLHFVDWMKAMGILLIVYGHLVGFTINFLTPPILPKQIGVACFLFVLAFVLARERRSAPQVVIHRLFTLYVIGVGVALVLSGCALVTGGHLQLSNYLPFLLGANVIMLQNAFPANPTTWYIATYVHVVLLWAFFGRHFLVKPWMIGFIALVEIGTRIVLADTAGPFAAYTALPNWLTVLFWGTWLGQESAKRGADRTARWPELGLAGLVLLLLIFVWPILGAGLHAYQGVPFEVIGTGAPFGITIVASIMVTVLYVSYADCVFRLTRALPAPAAIQFVARNTLLIFLAHMPVFYVIGPILERRLSLGAAKIVELLICIVGIGLISEAIFRVFDVATFRDRLFNSDVIAGSGLLGWTIPRPGRAPLVSNRGGSSK